MAANQISNRVYLTGDQAVRIVAASITRLPLDSLALLRSQTLGQLRLQISRVAVRTNGRKKSVSSAVVAFDFLGSFGSWFDIQLLLTPNCLP